MKTCVLNLNFILSLHIEQRKLRERKFLDNSIKAGIVSAFATNPPDCIEFFQKHTMLVGYKSTCYGRSEAGFPRKTRSVFERGINCYLETHRGRITAMLCFCREQFPPKSITILRLFRGLSITTTSRPISFGIVFCTPLCFMNHIVGRGVRKADIRPASDPPLFY